jgi:hypothetical protein
MELIAKIDSIEKIINGKRKGKENTIIRGTDKKREIGTKLI